MASNKGKPGRGKDKNKSSKKERFPSKREIQGEKKGFFSRFKIGRKSELDKISKEVKKTDSAHTELTRQGFLEKIGLKKKALPPEEELKREAKKVKKRLEAEKKKKLRHKFQYFIDKAGVEGKERTVTRRLLFSAASIYILLSIYITVQYYIQYDLGIGTLLLWMFKMTPHWIILLAAVLFGTWLSFQVYLDLRIHQRRQAIEAVFPDFLQLASANIRAGMALDRALWFAVRPQFGILSHEIEEVAKETLSGTDLEVALQNFSDKYESPMVKRAVTLLIEGMNSGGEVGNLLSKIALNIQESQILRKEMSADVISYSMFIAIATILAAPFLFALSGQLLVILKGILSQVATSGGGAGGGTAAGGGGGLSFTFSEISLSIEDYNKFAYLALTITSGFSGAIIATIRKGDIKSGISTIPVFIAITLILYLIASKGLGLMMGGFF